MDALADSASYRELILLVYLNYNINWIFISYDDFPINNLKSPYMFFLPLRQTLSNI